MAHRHVSIMTLVGIMIGLAGCVNLGPNFHPPDLKASVPAAYQHEEPVDALPVPDDRWWEIFGDPELNRLVDTVIERNWDIREAAERAMEIHARYVQARSDRFPRIGADGAYSRRRIGGSQVARAITVDDYDVFAGAVYEVDLWGRLARTAKAAWQDALEAEANRLTVAQSIVAEAINLYLQIEATERRLQIARLSVSNFRKSLDFVGIRYRRGLISVLDVRQARRVLAEAEARIPELQQELGILQQQLAVLAGRYPETRQERLQPDDYFKRLPPVPPGLPSDLLLRRPDLRAAEARLRAQTDRVAAARAARFPTITLTGDYGYSSDELSTLVRPDSVLWNLTLGITQPIFDAGDLEARQRAEEARLRQEEAAWARAVLTAFSEVEAALLTRKKQLARREGIRRFVEEARATQRVAQNRYIRGLINYLDVLDAQQTRFQAEDILILVDLIILANRVQLHRALGGGWADPGPADQSVAVSASESKAK